MSLLEILGAIVLFLIIVFITLYQAGLIKAEITYDDD